MLTCVCVLLNIINSIFSYHLFVFVGWYFVYNSLGSLCLSLFCGNNSLVGNLFYVCIVFAFLFKMPCVYGPFMTS